MEFLTRKKDDFPLTTILDDIFSSDEIAKKYNTSITPMNIYEKNDYYTIELFTPGINKKNINLVLKNNIIEISYKNIESQKDNDKTYYKKEFEMSSFERKLALPKDANQSKITSSYKNGILEIKISKEKFVGETKEIEIK